MAEVPTLYFPSDKEKARLRLYGTNEKLLEGNHFSAYTPDEQFLQRYSRLRYLTCNFAGLVSKVIADTLFGEEVQVSAHTNQKADEFFHSLFDENDLHTQFYESALMNSARGDAVFRVRVKDGQIKIEDINPSMYFPSLSDNFREEPKTKTLAWRETYDGKTYLIKEIHTEGEINKEVWLMKGEHYSEAVNKVSIEKFNKISGGNHLKTQETGIDEIPIIHIPNFRINNNYYGTSDYHDLESLFLAINNRITKIDNILDKHSDPILAVPEGVLDEDGKVRKESLGMIEVTSEDGGKPEYIVWNANLDSAFQQIDEIVKMIFLVSEVSPDVVGVDTKRGAVESGRALKLRMLRTIAKKNRKALYYKAGLQKTFRIAMKFAKNGHSSGDVKYTGEVITPHIEFADGVVDDKFEQIQNETSKLDYGLTSQQKAIEEVNDLDPARATELKEQIDKESPQDSHNLFGTKK